MVVYECLIFAVTYYKVGKLSLVKYTANYIYKLDKKINILIKRIFDNRKRKTLFNIVFIFSISQVQINLLKFEKHKNNGFWNNKNFFNKSDVGKIKMIFHR